MNTLELKPVGGLSRGTVLTKATVRAGQRLQLTNKTIAKIIGVSESTVSRMSVGEFELQERHKSFELAALFIRFYRSLDALVGGDDVIAAQWMHSHNTGIGGQPLEMIQTIQGLTDVIHYLDARRAIV